MQWRRVTSFPVEANDSTPYRLHNSKKSQNYEANEIVQHNKRPMGIPFLAPMNDRIFNWDSPVGVAQ